MSRKKINPKAVKLSELTQKPITQIAEELGMTRQYLSSALQAPVPTIKFALKMEDATGVNHQFFLYAYPLCLQFATKVK
jgi:hypothetical protein